MNNNFNINRINNDSLILIIGEPKSGKTLLIKDILDKKNIENGIIYSNRADAYKYSKYNIHNNISSVDYVVYDNVNVDSYINNNILRIVALDYINIVNIPKPDYIFVLENPYKIHYKIEYLYSITYKYPKKYDCVVIDNSDKSLYKYNINNNNNNNKILCCTLM